MARRWEKGSEKGGVISRVAKKRRIRREKPP